MKIRDVCEGEYVCSFRKPVTRYRLYQHPYSQVKRTYFIVNLGFAINIVFEIYTLIVLFHLLQTKHQKHILQTCLQISQATSILLSFIIVLFMTFVVNNTPISWSIMVILCWGASAVTRPFSYWLIIMSSRVTAPE